MALTEGPTEAIAETPSETLLETSKGALASPDSIVEATNLDTDMCADGNTDISGNAQRILGC